MYVVHYFEVFSFLIILFLTLCLLRRGQRSSILIMLSDGIKKSSNYYLEIYFKYLNMISFFFILEYFAN